jgi:hypothetical protein
MYFEEKMKEYNLNIGDVCKSNRVTRLDGKVVHDLIVQNWSSADSIVIDFGNILIASVSFLDEAFGTLTDEHSTKEISEKIKFVNITTFDRNLANGIYQSRYKQRQTQSNNGSQGPVPF